MVSQSPVYNALAIYSIYLSDIETLAIACELLLSQFALFLEFSELGLLRKDLIFARL
jgi:hypothetical protein